MVRTKKSNNLVRNIIFCAVIVILVLLVAWVVRYVASAKISTSQALANAQNYLDTNVNSKYSYTGGRQVEVKKINNEQLYGWVISYDTKNCVNENDIDNCLFAVAPLFVERSSGKVLKGKIGTGQPIEYYLRQIEIENCLRARFDYCVGLVQ